MMWRSPHHSSVTQWNLLHSGNLRQSTWWWPWSGRNMSLVNI